MDFRLRIYLLILLMVLASLLRGQDASPTDVLFVGNSYTYFWNLAQSVEVLSKANDTQLECVHSTAGGTNLRQHWRGEKKLRSKQRIESGKFEVVILQDHSRRAIDAPDSLLYFGKLLADLAEDQGAKVFLYMTWAREYDPYMQGPIAEQYIKLEKETGATIVPAGLAWQRARELRPGFPLYDEDQSHPSPLGTYLTACVFYKVLTGKSPLGLAHRIIGKDENGDALYLNIQSKENALFCQKVAEEIVEKFNKR